MFKLWRREEMIHGINGDRQRRENLTATLGGLSWWAGASLCVLLLTAVGEAWGKELLAFDTRRFLSVFSGAALVAAAAASVGGLLGFLFGIPRTLQQELASSTATASTTSPSPASQTDLGGVSGVGQWSYRQSVNTNLEQISDWLTKILVGVGLTQLTELPRQLWALAANFSLAGGVPFTLALILNFLICGFFTGYLLTRLFLAGAFYEAESWLRSQTEKATILAQVGAHDKAASEYEKALQGITSTTPKEQKRYVYEGLIFNFLYQDPPEGFERTMEYAQRYISEEPQFPSARIWAYLAAAYGQQYKYELSQGKSPDELSSIKEKALQATKEAIRIDPQIKGLLQMMWDPRHPLKSPEDDDLEVFYPMEEFKRELA